jgi:hypothetical protein
MTTNAISEHPLTSAERQRRSRAKRRPLTNVIHAKFETFWDGVPKKVGKQQQTLFAYTNWLAGEQENEIPIVPDMPNPRLEAVPGAFHKLFDEANTIGAMRERIRGYFNNFRFLGWGSGEHLFVLAILAREMLSILCDELGKLYDHPDIEVMQFGEACVAAEITPAHLQRLAWEVLAEERSWPKR